jgi:hypothetical protein
MIDVVELAKRLGLPVGEKTEIQGKILFKVIDVYDGDRNIRGKKYKQSIITFPSILRKTIFKRSKKFLAYIVFVDGKPALLLEPAITPTKEDLEEFLKVLAQKSVRQDA